MSTIKDVARHAGVSVATVSRVLNRKGPLSEKAIEKVKAAVEELNYHPNLLARSLASGRNSTIGVILPSFNTPFWSEMAQMIENSAKELNYRVIFSTMSSDVQKRFDAVDYLRNLQVNGIIFCGSMRGDGRLQEQLRHVKDIPLAILIDQVEGLPCIVSDDTQGGMYATRHLIAKGCKNIVHISADLNIYEHTNEKTYSFMRECEKHGVNYRIYDNHSAMPTMEEAQVLLDRIFQEYPEMDAIFLKNDILAAECVSYVMARGMRIPEDIRIVGYNDLYFSSLVYPPLTTIRNNYKMLAQTVLRCILDQVEGKGVPNLTVVPVELIERRTT